MIAVLVGLRRKQKEAQLRQVVGTTVTGMWGRSYAEHPRLVVLPEITRHNIPCACPGDSSGSIWRKTALATRPSQRGESSLSVVKAQPWKCHFRDIVPDLIVSDSTSHVKRQICLGRDAGDICHSGIVMMSPTPLQAPGRREHWSSTV